MGEIITEPMISESKPEVSTISRDDSFKGKYTTSDKAEVDKIVLSNDAYAIGQMLECLINKMGRL